MQIDFSNASELETLRNLCEKERQRLSDWIETLGEATDRSMILRLRHVTKMTYAIGALYGEVLMPTE